MSAKRKQLSLKEQIELEKHKIWDLYCKSRVLEAIENTDDKTFKQIYDIYNYSFNLWGGVEFEFWIQALAKKCKSYNAEISNLSVFALANRNDSEKMKIRRLEVIAKQMGLDVSIQSNRK